MELTKDDIEDLRELFLFYDKTGTGVVPIDKVHSILQNSRFANEGKDLKKLVSAIDSTNKGSLSFEQLLAGLQKKTKEGDPRRDLIEAFKVFDKKGTGFVAALELIEIITKYKTELGVSESEINQLVRDADLDGDGQIEYHEFVKMLFEVDQMI